MTKKQYFMILWGLCSVLPILIAIALMRIEKDKIPGPWYTPTVLVTLFTVLTVIGVLLFFGIVFAKKIGMRLLLLDNNLDRGSLIKSVIFVIVLCFVAVLGGIFLGFPLGGILLYYLHMIFIF